MWCRKHSFDIFTEINLWLVFQVHSICQNLFKGQLWFQERDFKWHHDVGLPHFHGLHWLLQSLSTSCITWTMEEPVLRCVSVCLTVWDVREKPINHFNGEHCVVTRIKDPFTFIPESIPTVLWALFQGPSHVFKFHHLVNCTQHTHN